MTTNTATLQTEPLPIKKIFTTWWPLAFSWLIMSVELTGVTAIIARFADPKINLAAYGSVVYPMALLLEGPILMMLVASTALSKDMASYLKVRRYMLVMSATMTAIHALLAFTPLYYSVVVRLIDPPVGIIEPARIGLMIMTPFSLSVAYRRFNQGVLIRFGHSNAVGLGTLLRLVADWSVLGIGYMIGTIPAVVVATTGVITGTCSEMLYIIIRVKPIIRNQLAQAPPVEKPITLRSFVNFYVPLALTSMVSFVLEPVISAALSRMPSPLESMAVWPIVSGFLFMVQTPGISFTEVAVTCLDEPRSYASLLRFATNLSIIMAVLMLVFVATPLAPMWFKTVTGLAPALASMAAVGAAITFLIPTFNVMQNFFQAVLVHSLRTRTITKAVFARCGAMLVVMGIGLVLNNYLGIFVIAAATMVGFVVQLVWLWKASDRDRRVLQQRDSVAHLPKRQDRAIPVEDASACCSPE